MPVRDMRHVRSEPGFYLKNRTAEGVNAGRVQLLVVLLAPQEIAHLPVRQPVDSDQRLSPAKSALESEPGLREAAAAPEEAEAFLHRLAYLWGLRPRLRERRGGPEGMGVFGQPRQAKPQDVERRGRRNGCKTGQV